MALRLRDGRALLMLVPANEKAKELLHDPDNSPCQDQFGKRGFDIGHRLSSSGDPSTLATVGRNGDIKLQGGIFSKIQCSFVVHETSKRVLFYDRSSNLSCRVYGGEREYPFEHGRTPRRVVVSPECNIYIGMGGERKDLLRFQLLWFVGPEWVQEFNKLRMNGVPPPAAHLAGTVDEMDTMVHSTRQTRIHTGERRFRMRFDKLERLGSGAFGEVHKAIDIDSGDLMAVKILYPRSELSIQQWTSVKREIEILSHAKHVCTTPPNYHDSV